jgi:hypothetical protein
MRSYFEMFNLTFAFFTSAETGMLTEVSIVASCTGINGKLDIGTKV